MTNYIEGLDTGKMQQYEKDRTNTIIQIILGVSFSKAVGNQLISMIKLHTED